VADVRCSVTISDRQLLASFAFSALLAVNKSVNRFVSNSNSFSDMASMLARERGPPFQPARLI
jgi:hypothetical protein